MTTRYMRLLTSGVSQQRPRLCQDVDLRWGVALGCNAGYGSEASFRRRYFQAVTRGELPQNCEDKPESP